MEKKDCFQIGCSEARYEIEGKTTCRDKSCVNHPFYLQGYESDNLCKHPKTWWTCRNCGQVTCRSCHAFRNPDVPVCINCVPEWLKKKKIMTQEQLDKKLRSFCSVGKILYDKAIERLADKQTEATE